MDFATLDRVHLTTLAAASAKDIQRMAAAQCPKLPLHKLSPPRVGMILGTGWDEVLNKLAKPLIWARVPFAEVSGLGVPGVDGHKGEIVYAEIAGELCVCFCGRLHLNEGALQEAPLGVRLMVEILRQLTPNGRRIITNAAGAYNSLFRVGDIMIVREFLDADFQLPTTDPSEGFYHSDEALHPELIAAARRVGDEIAAAMHSHVHEGVFKWTLGPHLGGAAQARAMKMLGADSVGMSGLPEVMVFSRYGEHVLFVNCISDLAWQRTTHDKNKKAVRDAAPRLLAFLEGNIRAWRADDFKLPPDPRWPEDEQKPVEAQVES